MSLYLFIYNTYVLIYILILFKFRTFVKSSKKRCNNFAAKCGPLFVKIVQFLYSKDQGEVILMDIALGENTIPHKHICLNNVNKYISNHFESFENVGYLCSGSISDVYQFESNRKKYIIKIPKKQIKNLMISNIKYFKIICRFAKIFSKKVKTYNLEKILDMMHKQCSMEHEKINTLRLRSKINIERCSIVDVYHGTDDYIIEQYVDGIMFNQMTEDHKLDARKRIIIAYFEMIFVYDELYADCNWGNVIFEKDKSVTFIDCGCVERFPQDVKQHTVNMITGILKKDSQLIINTLSHFTHVNNKISEDIITLCNAFIEDPSSSVNTFINTFINTIVSRNIVLPIHLTICLLNISILCGKTNYAIDEVICDINNLRAGSPQLHKIFHVIVKPDKRFLVENDLNIDNELDTIFKIKKK